MTDLGEPKLLGQAYSPDHPLHLDGPAGAAVLLAVTDLQDVAVTVDEHTAEVLLDVHIIEQGGTMPAHSTFIDAGLFTSARAAFAAREVAQEAHHDAHTAPAAEDDATA